MTDVLLAIFTGLLVLVTGFLAWIAYRQQTTMKATQRAYVKMSHSTSLTLDPTTGEGAVSISVTNDGLTPAQILDTGFVYTVLLQGTVMPTEPDYSESDGQELPQAFLSAKDHYNHHLTLEIDPALIANVMNGNAILWVYGFVDYEDIFGQKHRGGYARIFNPSHTDSRNLGFVSQPGYNYDRTL